jgi:hypothetical protein
LLLLCWLLDVAGAALAQAEPPVRVATEPRGDQPRPGINWVRLPGASDCLSAPALVMSVEARLGRSLFVATSLAKVFVDGHVARVAAGFEVVLEVSDSDGAVLGQRAMHFDGDDCKVIEDAVTLVIAVTLYPNSALPAAGIALKPGTAQRLDALFGDESLDPNLASLPSVDPTAPPRERATSDGAPPAPERPPTQSAGLRFALAGAATFGIGQLPSPALGLAAYGVVTPRSSLSIEAGFLYFPANVALADGGAGAASFALLLGSIAVCPVQPDWLRRLDLCIGAEAGQVHVEASGFVFDNQRADDLVVNLRASGVWQVPVAGGFFLRVALLASAPLLQRNYTFRGPDNAPESLFRMPQAAVRADLGLGLTL